MTDYAEGVEAPEDLDARWRLRRDALAHAKAIICGDYAPDSPRGYIKSDISAPPTDAYPDAVQRLLDGTA